MFILRGSKRWIDTRVDDGAGQLAKTTKEGQSHPYRFRVLARDAYRNTLNVFNLFSVSKMGSKHEAGVRSGAKGGRKTYALLFDLSENRLFPIASSGPLTRLLTFTDDFRADTVAPVPVGRQTRSPAPAKPAPDLQRKSKSNYPVTEKASYARSEYRRKKLLRRLPLMILDAELKIGLSGTLGTDHGLEKWI